MDTVGPWRGVGEASSRAALPSRPAPGAWSRRERASWRLVVATVGSCLRYRVTGLAAEAAFFAVLSVPPLIFALAGASATSSDQFTPPRSTTCATRSSTSPAGADPEGGAQDHRADHQRRAGGGRFDVISLGFVLALWSGSRALNVFVDTITIMHGLGGHRGIVRTRALSFVLYVLAIVTGVVSIPLVLAGPRWSSDGCPSASTSSAPSTGRSSSWSASASSRRSITCRCRCGPTGVQPARRDVLARCAGSSAATCYAGPHRDGPGLTVDLRPAGCPIAVLLWLYLVAIAVLIGAAVNAAFDRVFPQKATTGARLEAAQPAGTRGRRAPPRERVPDAAGRSTRFYPCPTTRATSRPHPRPRDALPEHVRSPWWELSRRLLAALAILVGTVALVYFDRAGYRDGNDPPARRQLHRLHLLHDRHAEHDRVRRHRAGHRPGPPDQRLRHHPGPHRLPGAADRDHPGGPRLAGPRDVPGRPLEEEHGSSTSSSSATAPRAAARSRPW